MEFDKFFNVLFLHKMYIFYQFSQGRSLKRYQDLESVFFFIGIILKNVLVKFHTVLRL